MPVALCPECSRPNASGGICPECTRKEMERCEQCGCIVDPEGSQTMTIGFRIFCGALCEARYFHQGPIPAS